MSGRVPFTTTLPVDVAAELTIAAQETGRMKNAILVEAFIFWHRTVHGKKSMHSPAMLLNGKADLQATRRYRRPRRQMP